MDIQKKYTYEEFSKEISFVSRLLSGETITNATAVAIDRNGNDSTSAVIKNGSVSETNGVVSLVIQNGTKENSPYYISARVETSTGNKYELQFKLEII